MRTRIGRMFFRYKRHRLSTWSALGMLLFGVATLALWIFNMLLFLQFVGYAATIYYIIDIEAGYAEEKVIGNSQHRLSKSDQFWLGLAQTVTAIIGIAELAVLIYCQVTNYYHFMLSAVFLTGLYFTYWTCLYGLSIYQVKRRVNIAARKWLIGEIVALSVMAAVMVRIYFVQNWVFFVTGIGIAIIEWIVSWRNYYVIKNGDRNAMGY